MKFLKVIGVMLTSTLLLACQTNWYESPDFGNSVNQAVIAQSVNPNAPLGNKTPTKGLDGPAAKAGIDNYQRSYEIKSTTGNYPSTAGSGTNSVGTTTK